MFITYKMPASISAESYKAIRTSIKYSSVDKPIKTIVVTSSVPGEGKSTVSGNLAISLSEAEDNKVLIIDCDLRRPTLHKKFHLSNIGGLTNYLVDKCDLKEIIQKFSARVSVISAGTIPPNPAEVLGSQALQDFIHRMEKEYDYIILDTPPILAVTDAQLLAAKADGTVMVVKYGKTKEKVIKAAYKELSKVKANVIGCILNCCDNKDKSAYYGNYYYYGSERKGIFKLFRRKDRRRRSRISGTGECNRDVAVGKDKEKTNSERIV